MDCRLFEFLIHGDDRGQLVSLESFVNIPFDIKRVYYMYDTVPDVTRGRHAHKSLKQVLVAVHGSCKVRLFDGEEEVTVALDRPDQGLYIGDLVWREMFDFSEDAVLMVLASELYNEADYIRDYDAFLQAVRERKEGGESR